MKTLSWRAKLARYNINILAIDDHAESSSSGQRWFYEFMYQPHRGQFKWCKTYYDAPYKYLPEQVAEALMEEVLSLRRELEQDREYKVSSRQAETI